MALSFYIFEFGMRKPTILCVCQRLCRYLNVFVIALYNYVDFCHSEIMDICISMSHFSLWFLFVVHTLDFKINEKGAFKEFFFFTFFTCLISIATTSKDTWSIWSVSSFQVQIQHILFSDFKIISDFALLCYSHFKDCVVAPFFPLQISYWPLAKCNTFCLHLMYTEWSRCINTLWKL